MGTPETAVVRTEPVPEERGTPGGAQRLIMGMKRATRKRYTAEEKIRIVLEGMRKELPVSELCRREGIHVNIYYVWLKEFMEAGKARLQGNGVRESTKGEVDHLKRENGQLKELVGRLTLENHLIKKSLNE